MHGRVTIAGEGAPDVVSRGGDVDGLAAPVAVAGQEPKFIVCGNSQHVRDAAKAARVVTDNVGIRGVVPSGADVQEVLRGLLDRRPEGRAEAGIPSGARRDVGAHLLAVVHAPDGVRDEAPALVSEELAGDDRDLVGDAAHALAVVARGPDDPRHVRPVAVASGVHRVAVVVRKVVPVHVVDKPVAIVVLAVPWDLARVPPDVAHQVRMRVVDAAIDDADLGNQSPDHQEKKATCMG